MAQLIVFLKERELSRHPIGSGIVRIGRDPVNEVVIDNVGVSRHHATIRYDGTSFQVTDEGSQNGSYVGGVRITTHTLKDGETLQLGKFSLRFSDTGETAPLAPSSPEAPRNRRGRDPQSTMALGADDVAKLMSQPTPMSGPETRREPPPGTEGGVSEGDASARSLLWVGLGLLAVVIGVGVAVFAR